MKIFRRTIDNRLTRPYNRNKRKNIGTHLEHFAKFRCSIFPKNIQVKCSDKFFLVHCVFHRLNIVEIFRDNWRASDRFVHHENPHKNCSVEYFRSMNEDFVENSSEIVLKLGPKIVLICENGGENSRLTRWNTVELSFFFISRDLAMKKEKFNVASSVTQLSKDSLLLLLKVFVLILLRFLLFFQFLQQFALFERHR